MRAVCISGCALSFVGSAFDVVFVLFCYSSVKMGGLGFSVNLLFLIANEVIVHNAIGFSDRLCSGSRRHFIGSIPDCLHADSTA